MPPNPEQPNAFGWIRLKNGDVDAGYIYLESPPVLPHLGGDDDYVVTSMPMSELSTVLDNLRNEKNLQIRFSDGEVEGRSPWVFIEVPPESVATEQPLNLPKELVEEVRELSLSKT